MYYVLLFAELCSCLKWASVLIYCLVEKLGGDTGGRKVFIHNDEFTTLFFNSRKKNLAAYLCVCVCLKLLQMFSHISGVQMLFRVYFHYASCSRRNPLIRFVL